MHQISLAIIVPQGRRVYHSLTSLDEHGCLPLAYGIISLHHIDTMVGVAPIDIELARVVAYAGCPYSFAMAWLAVELYGRNLTQGIVDELPVDEVLGMQDRESRCTGETRCRHVEVISHATHVGIGVVGM